MALSKKQRESIAAAEAIVSTIAKRKEQGKDVKEGVDLVGLTEKLAERRQAATK